jgi:uncharacterized FlaG/YvyC family protein
MAIDATHLDRTIAASEPLVEPPVRNSLLNPAAAPATADSNSAVSPSAVEAAVKQIQAAINTGPNPAFTLDYLSGLSVVTVRSNQTGEVVFQLPDSRAVELARLIKEGTSLGSLGLLHTKA